VTQCDLARNRIPMVLFIVPSPSIFLGGGMFFRLIDTLTAVSTNLPTLHH
jgi:hypothetical protein